VLLDNLILFFIFSILITVLSFAFPPRLLNPRSRWLSCKVWEENGAIYQRLFKVRKWKDSLPELADFIKKPFKKKKIQTFDASYLETYVVETCRAELTHLFIIISAFLFPLWATPSVSLSILLLSIVLNAPFIIIQRYNRPRIIQILARSKHIYPEVKAEDVLF
jgi:glycosyl-4,4'-diaponeurosporenoate acyltransferase